MTTIPLIRQHYFADVVATLECMNADVDRVLRRHGIPEWQYGAPEEGIPLVHYISAFDVGARATGEGRFGLLVAARNELDRFGFFGDALTRSLTVYAAMRTACRLASKEATTVRFWLQPADGGILFCRKQLVATPDIAGGLIQLERYTLTLLLQIVQLGAGRDWRPSEAWLSVSGDAGVPKWEAFADATIHFEAPFSAFFVPDSVLSLPIADRTAARCMAAGAAERRLREVWAERDLVSMLRVALQPLLRQNGADVETVAEIAGLSSRTLQRRLAQEGTSFSEVLEQARYQAAARLLRQSDIAVADVSDRLGYEHPQHFIRAFRRWAGVTPGRYRRSHSAP